MALGESDSIQFGGESSNQLTKCAVYFHPPFEFQEKSPTRGNKAPLERVFYTLVTCKAIEAVGMEAAQNHSMLGGYLKKPTSDAGALRNSQTGLESLDRT